MPPSQLWNQLGRLHSFGSCRYAHLQQPKPTAGRVARKMSDHGRISRRVFLTRLGGVTLSLGSMPWWLPRVAFGKDPYAGGVWLAGDHHIHTKYSPDGQYEIIEQVTQARRHGLSWCVITDHGGPRHDKVVVEQAYPELLAARKRHPAVHVFQGLEWNVPEADHGTVILPPTPDEAKIIAEFERRYDSKNFSLTKLPARTEKDAVEAVKYLQSLTPKPLFFVNHPARTGRVSPMEMRAWAGAGPDVTRGFEGAPGHQAASLIHAHRGHYHKSPVSSSWHGYPEESYRTFGGYDWYVAKVGGLWDSLLGEGRPWYITANSDAHRHHSDHRLVDPGTYLIKGHVTPTTQPVTDPGAHGNIDFWPGEYSKTWVYATHAEPMAVLSALRSGSMFTVHGDLIDRLELRAKSADSMAPMGGTLMLEKRGEAVDLTVRMREASGENFGGLRPRLHHFDLIVGDILGPAADRSVMVNESTRVLVQVSVKEMQREGPWLSYRHRFDRFEKDFYIRLRGTNRDLAEPEMDSLTVNPWEDLWFYSNPVMVRIRKT